MFMFDLLLPSDSPLLRNYLGLTCKASYGLSENSPGSGLGLGSLQDKRG